jgi:hypothetical protein
VAGEKEIESRDALARAQLAAAREDPRTTRGRGAMLADYWDAMEEAERVRQLGVFGLHEMTSAVARRRQELEARGVSDPGRVEAELEAARELEAMARGEVANEHPHLHATGLISMLSALDALVEELVTAVREMLAHVHVEQQLEELPAQVRPHWEALEPKLREKLTEALTATVLGERVASAPRGPGVERYETVLRRAGLAAPASRPLPEDLCQALGEIIQLRHVLVHRAGRVDERALAAAPSLPYEDDEFVRINRSDYRTYSAAITTYGAEVIRRLMRDLGPDINLTAWREEYVVNA